MSSPERAGRRTRRLLLVLGVVLAVWGLTLVAGRSRGDEEIVPPVGPPLDLPDARATYYVDASLGSDRNSGDSADRAWQSLGRVARSRLEPGAHVLFKRGETWRGTLRILRSGSAGKPILLGAYGDGERPRFTRGEGAAPMESDGEYEGAGSGACLHLAGSDLHVRDLEITGCRPARAGVKSDGDGNVIERLLLTRNEAAIVISEGADDNRVLSNVMRDNDLMTVNTCAGGGDDYGAYNVALEGATDAEVAYNYAQGAVAESCDYGEDGSMVELVRSGGAWVHHNTSVNNQTFAEVGGAGAEGNRFEYNRVFSSEPESAGFVIHGGGEFAGAVDTSLEHNSVRLVGDGSLGLTCFAVCSPDILRARDNVFAAALPAESPSPFDEDYNLYSAPVAFPRGSHSLVADPQFADEDGLRLAPDSPAAGAAEARAGTRGDAPRDMGAVPVRGARAP